MFTMTANLWHVYSIYKSFVTAGKGEKGNVGLLQSYIRHNAHTLVLPTVCRIILITAVANSFFSIYKKILLALYYMSLE